MIMKHLHTVLYCLFILTLFFGMSMPLIPLHAQSSDSSVDILWEADSYTPPLYRGKGLRVGPQQVKFVAFPYVTNTQGNTISNQSLYFTWKVSGRVIGRASGLGQNVAYLNLSLKDTPVTLEVYSSDRNTLYAKETVLVDNSEPEVLVYEKDPLLGILFNKRIDSDYTLQDEETEFVAFPYFFSVTHNSSSSLEYLWKINNTYATRGVGKSSILLQKGGARGSSLVSIEVIHTKNVFQEVLSKFTVSLGDTL